MKIKNPKRAAKFDRHSFFSVDGMEEMKQKEKGKKDKPWQIL